MLNTYRFSVFRLKVSETLYVVKYQPYQGDYHQDDKWYWYEQNRRSKREEGKKTTLMWGVHCSYEDFRANLIGATVAFVTVPLPVRKSLLPLQHSTKKMKNFAVCYTFLGIPIPEHKFCSLLTQLNSNFSSKMVWALDKVELFVHSVHCYCNSLLYVYIGCMHFHSYMTDLMIHNHLIKMIDDAHLPVYVRYNFWVSSFGNRCIEFIALVNESSHLIS